MSTPETPPVPEPAIQRGARLLAEGDAEAAVAVLRGLVAEAPIYAAAHVMLAASLDAAGRPAEGLDAWHRAAFLVPASRLVQRKRLRLPEPAATPEPAAQPAGAEAPASDGTLTETPAAETPPTEAPSATVPDPDPPAPPPAPGLPPLALEPTTPTADSPSDAAATDATASPSRDAPTDDAATPAEPPGADRSETAPPSSDLPESARASADEFISTDAEPRADLAPPDADVPDGPSTLTSAPEPTAPEPSDEAPARPGRPARPPAPPDWGDLGDPALAVIPPQDPDDAAPPRPQDPGGWAVVAERERSAPERRGVVPPVIRPESWTPPAEPERVHLAGAPVRSAAQPPATPPAETPPATTPPTATSLAETPPADEPALADDLDALIESLDAAPRITPDPDFDGPSPVKDQDDVDDLASETMARIYAAQHQFAAAAAMYERLAARSPERAEELLDLAAEMRRKAKK